MRGTMQVVRLIFNGFCQHLYIIYICIATCSCILKKNSIGLLSIFFFFFFNNAIYCRYSKRDSSYRFFNFF